MKILSDAIVPDFVEPSPDTWLLVGIIAAVAAVTAVAVVIIVKRKKKKKE